MVLAHALAGLAFGVIATLLLLPMSGMEHSCRARSAVVWALAWPTVLVLGLIVGPDRRAQGLIGLGYLGGLLVLSAIAWLRDTPDLPLFGVTVPGFVQPGVLWAIDALPSLFLLLFLNRTIRAIGPLRAGLRVRGFARLPPRAHPARAGAGHQGGRAICGGERHRRRRGLLGLCRPRHPCRPVAGLADRDVPARPLCRQALERTIATIGAIWLLQSLSLSTSLYREQGGLGALAAILPLLGWRLTLYAGLRPLLTAARTRPPRRLLLLRVFGFGRRSRRLLDLIGTRWRLIGSIDLIAAPNLASRTVEPATFLEFVRGRLGRLFVRTPAVLEERLAALDRGPDPDARFRVNQLFCSDAMWQQAVIRLMGEASLVVMDLRGFGPQRRGCVFELQTLLDTVPVNRLMFLFDRTTNRRALEGLLTERWQKLDAASPNLRSSIRPCGCST